MSFNKIFLQLILAIKNDWAWPWWWALVPDNPKDYDNDTFDNDIANGIIDHDNHKDKYFFPTW